MYDKIINKYLSINFYKQRKIKTENKNNIFFVKNNKYNNVQLNELLIYSITNNNISIFKVILNNPNFKLIPIFSLFPTIEYIFKSKNTIFINIILKNYIYDIAVSNEITKWAYFYNHTQTINFLHKHKLI